MQEYPLLREDFQIEQQTIRLYVPDPSAVPLAGKDKAPYWARVWPASVALANFITRHPQWVAGKSVLELGAGMGLPGLAAATHARHVVLSDRSPQAVAIMQQSVLLNGFTNVEVQQLDWFHLPESLHTDCLLLSDVNYDPEHFTAITAFIKRFLQKGATVLLGTPQRLMAKPFISGLLLWCIHQENVSAPDGVDSSIFILRQT